MGQMSRQISKVPYTVNTQEQKTYEIKSQGIGVNNRKQKTDNNNPVASNSESDTSQTVDFGFENQSNS